MTTPFISTQGAQSLEATEAPDPFARPGRAAIPKSGTLLRVVIFVYLTLYLARLHESLGFSIPIGKILLPLGFLALVTQRRFEKRLAVLRSTQAVMFAVLLFGMANSVPFSLWPTGSLADLQTFLIGPVLIVALVALSCGDEQDLYGIARAMVFGAGALGLMMMSGMGHVSLSEGRASFGSTYDPNDIALVGVVVFPFALLLMRDKRGLWRWIAGVGAAGALTLVMMSASRGGTLGLAAVVLIITFRRGQLTLGWKLAVAALLGVGLFFAPANFWTRVETLKDPGADYNASSDTGRLQLWTRGLGYFAYRPLTGVGLGQFATADGAWAAHVRGTPIGFTWHVAHSIWIQTLAELGVFGFIGFVGLYLPTLRDVRRLRRAAGSRAPPGDRLVAFGEALGIAIIGFFVSGTFLAMAFSPPAMLLAAMGMAFSYLVRSRLGAARRKSVRARWSGAPARA